MTPHVLLTLAVFMVLFVPFYSASDTKFALEFFNLSMSLFNRNGNRDVLPVIHLIRVPKASSSSLSAVARKFVGCNPPGPCCRYPGDPPGSCPAEGLFECQVQKKVMGCTHHYPNLQYLTKMPSISMLREPRNRSLSAYFYPGIHHNSQCKGDLDTCFIQYTNSLAWQNIGVKMMTGLFSYSPAKVCQKRSQCSHSLDTAVDNMKKLTLMGIAEMWELSILVLFRKIPSIEPYLEAFAPSYEKSSGARLNNQASYLVFRKTAMIKYSKELELQNSLDIILYEKAIAMLCDQIHALDLWKYSSVRSYWTTYSPIRVERCATV